MVNLPSGPDVESIFAPDKKYVMVASIDFGTTFSGYAFSFKGSEDAIKLNKNWANSSGFLSYKVPTSVLVDKNCEFVAFGYEAEEKFYDDDSDSEDEGESLDRADKYNLFKHFKMVLHKKEKLTLQTTISSTSGQILPAIDIFTHALRYLRNHLIEESSRELVNPIDEDMIRWVITVPAIWSEESKQFMREAAFRGGCINGKDSRQLVVALEPEAASFFCRRLDLKPFESTEDIPFRSGTRYIVLDCGGGTNDMVVHEVLVENTVKEICVVTGGSHGGNQVNETFVELLKDTLGADFIEHFKQKEPNRWLSLMMGFERSKKKAKPDGKSKIKIELPSAIEREFITFKNGKEINSAFGDIQKALGITLSNGTLILNTLAVQNLFQNTIAQIINDIKEIFQKPNTDHIDFLFMVGGFCESPFLQEAIKTEFEPQCCRVLVPNEAQLAVIKGAVLYGHYQDQIESRIVRRTYGVNCNRLFQADIHDSHKQYVNELGETVCKDVFDAFVQKGDEIHIGSMVNKGYHICPSENSCLMKIYSIDGVSKEPVQYSDGPEVRRVGSIHIKLPSSNKRLTVSMTFGGTEIHVSATEKGNTENTIATIIDFLSE